MSMSNIPIVELGEQLATLRGVLAALDQAGSCLAAAKLSLAIDQLATDILSVATDTEVKDNT